MITPATTEDEDVVLPAATRDFILEALSEATIELRRTNGMRATRHIMVDEGVKLTRDNSFRIDNANPLLLMNLVRRMLVEPGST